MVRDSSRPIQGFNPRDEHELVKASRSDPQVQMFTEEDLEDEEINTFYCSLCKCKLEWLIGPGEYFCGECGVTYDPRIQDKPLVDTKDFKVRTYPEFEYYQVYDDKDIKAAFMEGVDLDRDEVYESQDVELVRSSPDERVKVYRVHGLPEDAMKVF